MNIYVSNLSYDSTSESLKKLFAEFGETTSATVINDKITGFSRGFGFIEMPDDAQGKKAIEELNETEFEGKIIKVNVARPRTDRNSGGNYNRGGGGFNSRSY